MTMTILRRQFLLTGLAFLVAPAIMRAASLMPIKSWSADQTILMRHAMRGFFDATPSAIIHSALR